MVFQLLIAAMISSVLSVLALSSRFDGQSDFRAYRGKVGLSVLALSSRFDGRIHPALASHPLATFSTRSVESF